MSFCCSVLLLSLVLRRVSCFSVANEVSNALFSKLTLLLVPGVGLGVIGGSAVYAVPLVEWFTVVAQKAGTPTCGDKHSDVE